MSVDAGPANPGPRSLTDLFMTLTRLALRGFGGVLPWAQRALVEERRWLTREEFVELLAFAQLLPGPNIVNLAQMLGDRYFGWRGALAALAGILLVPTLVLLAIFTLFAQYSSDPTVRAAMTGMAAVAAGLIMATAIKLALALRKRWRWLAFGVGSFVLVGVLRVPLATTLLVLAPIAIAVAWHVERKEPAP